MRRQLAAQIIAKIRGGASPLAASFTCAAITLLYAGLSGLSFPPQDLVALKQGQSLEEANRKSTGCITCHSPMDEPTMHPTKTVQLGCTDCHGGNSSASVTPDTAQNSQNYVDA